MKRIIYFCLTILISAILFGCGEKEKDNMTDTQISERLTGVVWESYAHTDFLEFTTDGKILYNFEHPEDCVSFYSLNDGKINMFSEEGEESGIELPVRFDGEFLYIGEQKYYPKDSDVEDVEWEFGNDIDQNIPSVPKKLTDDEITERICSGVWKLDNELVRFTENGKVLFGFELPENALVSYTISDGEITFITEDYMTTPLKVEFRADNMYIGDSEYIPANNTSEKEEQ